RPAGQGTPSVASEAAAVQAALARTIADLRQIQQTKPKKSLRVFVGAGHVSTGAEVTAFFPAQLSVNVGDTVTFVNHDQTGSNTNMDGTIVVHCTSERMAEPYESRGRRRGSHHLHPGARKRGGARLRRTNDQEPAPSSQLHPARPRQPNHRAVAPSWKGCSP